MSEKQLQKSVRFWDGGGVVGAAADLAGSRHPLSIVWSLLWLVVVLSLVVVVVEMMVRMYSGDPRIRSFASSVRRQMRDPVKDMAFDLVDVATDGQMSLALMIQRANLHAH
jgi:hypothetical protein